LFLDADDFPEYLAEELDPTFNVAVGGGVDSEAVYPVDLPAGEDLVTETGHAVTLRL
jgi:hypothetical protein